VASINEGESSFYKIQKLKKFEYLRTLYGKTLKNLEWVERFHQVSSCGIMYCCCC